MAAVPLNVEALIAADLCGEKIDVDAQIYQTHRTPGARYEHEVVSPDGKLVLSTSSEEYAKDFAYAMNRCRWHRLNPDDGK